MQVFTLICFEVTYTCMLFALRTVILYGKLGEQLAAFLMVEMLTTVAAVLQFVDVCCDLYSPIVDINNVGLVICCGRNTNAVK